MKTRKLLINTALIVTSVLIASLLFDRALILFGFPSEVPEKVTHPPHYTSRVKNVEFEYTFTTNSQGLRNPEIPLRRSEREYRLLMVGDSFVQGIGMEMHETIPAYLSEMLSTTDRKVTVINGGLAGTGPVEYGKLAFHLLNVYDIDAVLITLFTNDVRATSVNSNPLAVYPPKPQRWGFDRLAHSLWPRIYTLVSQAIDGTEKSDNPTTTKKRVRGDRLSRFSVEAAERGIEQQRIEEWQRRVKKWLEGLPPEQRNLIAKGAFNWNGLTYGLSRPDYWSIGIDFDTPLAQQKWTALAAVVDEIVNGLRSRGKDVAVVYIPSKWQYDPNSHSPTNTAYVSGFTVRKSWLSGELEIDRRLVELERQLDVPLLNLTSGMRKKVAAGDKLNWKYDDHLTSGGNRFVAETVSEWIKSGQVFDGLP